MLFKIQTKKKKKKKTLPKREYFSFKSIGEIF